MINDAYDQISMVPVRLRAAARRARADERCGAIRVKRRLKANCGDPHLQRSDERERV